MSIFLQSKTSSLDREVKRHTCTSKNPCVPKPGYRSFVAADWVKFAGIIFQSKNPALKAANDVKENYLNSWNQLYEGDPELEEDGSPVDYMDVPTVLPSLGIPWFPYPDVNTHTAPGPSSTSVNISADPSSRTLDGLLRSYEPHYDLGGLYPRLLDFSYDIVHHSSNIAPNKRMNAVFILSTLHSVVEGNSFTQTAAITEEQFNKIHSVFPDCIEFLEHVKDGRFKVLVETFVLFSLDMNVSTSKYRVKYMNIKQYHSALTKRNNSDWNLLLEADLVMGGIELGDDILFDFTSSGMAEKYYGLKPNEMLDHWDGLMALKKHTYIWPDPDDFFEQGSKLHLASMAQAVAQSENQLYPICAIVEPTLEIVNDILTGACQGVLKREWSSTSTHVIYKGKHGDLAQEFTETLHARRTLERQLAKKRSHPLLRNPPKWYIQPFISSLTDVGEIRVFIVNGMILENIITRPVDDESGCHVIWENPSQISTLDVIKNLAEGKPFHHPYSSLLNADHVNAGILIQSIKHSYQVFALRTLSKLILAEEFITKRESGLRIFARLDITVLTTGNGNCQFLVNEITRGHNAGTWGSFINQEPLIHEMVHVLHFLAYNFKKSQCK
ncbi:hypothetical protein BDN70DRAFT_900049 [Pholiota conissans]|uniref:Uncharacterized protein n=1 Tax=Pholiota conissans TaxID=109636 RepID=A0A9P6CTJ3_9AGAR|nr:hypothetical protein BDN70DRAFT_900049 [Pholiota conissans]